MNNSFSYFFRGIANDFNLGAYLCCTQSPLWYNKKGWDKNHKKSGGFLGVVKSCMKKHHTK